MTCYNSERFNEKIAAAHKEQERSKKAALLHEAEQILMEDMPVIPIIFNQYATLTSKDLTKITYTWYGQAVFTKAKLKNYLLYTPIE